VFRLNHKAFKILATEIEKAAAKDSIAGEVASKIALQRLKKLYSQKGMPVTEAELKELVQDILPDFSDRAIKKAIKVNRPPSKLWLLPKGGIVLATLAGTIWVLNLPYPMIRRPVARVAPILLLPSYQGMDYNYRNAIALSEQADQLVNQATSLADLELGKEKVTQAQQHLDKLPVWFLGYQPQIYATWFRFGWFFTLDEFKVARANVGRMEAKIFQETNAMKQLKEIETTIQKAKQSYQQTSDNTSKQNALSNWQSGIDELTQLPKSTLASELADAKLTAYYRNFREVSGFIAGNNRTNILISAAQAFSNEAIVSCENPPHSVEKWRNCADLWQEAISRLKQIPLEDPGYLDAQSLLANYQTNLAQIVTRKQAEIDSVTAFDLAQSQIAELPTQVNNVNRERVIRQIKQIIIQLKKVRANTTVARQAKDLIVFAEKKLQEIEN
jgi:hypothetical protein